MYIVMYYFTIVQYIQYENDNRRNDCERNPKYISFSRGPRENMTLLRIEIIRANRMSRDVH